MIAYKLQDPRPSRRGLCEWVTRAKPFEGARQEWQDETLNHECQLSRAHFGPHQCWCSCTFERDGTVYLQANF